MKIGIYTEDEIFNYMTDCEGSMLGRSMYDAIFDKVYALITENQQLKDNWNKLKEFIAKEYYMYLPLEATTKSITILIDKMQELKKSDKQ